MMGPGCPLVRQEEEVLRWPTEMEPLEEERQQQAWVLEASIRDLQWVDVALPLLTLPLLTLLRVRSLIIQTPREGLLSAVLPLIKLAKMEASRLTHSSHLVPHPPGAGARSAAPSEEFR